MLCRESYDPTSYGLNVGPFTRLKRKCLDPTAVDYACDAFGYRTDMYITRR